MTVLFFLVAGFLLYTAVNLQISKRRQEKLKREQQEQKKLLRLQKAEAVALARKQVELERDQIKLRKEQERQAAQLAKHEEQIMKLEQRMASAEVELEFNRDKRDKLFELLELEELERDSCTKGSSFWQKHQKKVMALENQLHTVQKRIDKAQWDKAMCESKLSA